jgi:two-component system response regulator HydG
LSEHSLIGQATAFTRVLNAVRMVAPTDATVLLRGETGAGKATLAREVHACSTRRFRPFLAFACAALPVDLFECGPDTVQGAELRVAAGGTLFLDEVADLGAGAQAALLRYLETGAVGPLAKEPLSLRVVAATAADLAARVGEGTFRGDLFHRLNVVPLEVPALRERLDDLPLLLKHYARAFAREHGRPASSFRPTAVNTLKAYDWPGNVRELRNLCQRLAILLPGAPVGRENLPLEMRSAMRNAGAVGFRLPVGGVDLNLLEKDVIRQALELAAGNRSQAARLLGISRDTLLYRIQKHGLAS